MAVSGKKKQCESVDMSGGIHYTQCTDIATWLCEYNAAYHTYFVRVCAVHIHLSLEISNFSI